MDIGNAVLLVAVGICAGWLNVMAGGGSLLSVPVLLFLGLPGPVANGTNRIAILAQNIVAVFAFFRQGYANFRLSLTLGLAAIPGAIAGASLGTQLDGPWFDRLLAAIMLLVMISMVTKKKTVSQNTSGQPQRLVLGHLCMVVAGFWGGFIQIGVGFVLMPILYRVMGLDLVQVNMHKVFIVLMYTIAALIIFATQVEVMWTLGLALAVGNAIGGWLGAKTTVTKGENLIKTVLLLVLSAFVIKLLFF